MKPLSDEVYDLDITAESEIVNNDANKVYLESDVRDAVLKFKQRKWKFVWPFHCHKCKYKTRLMSDNLCIDCALEQDMGKELMGAK